MTLQDKIKVALEQGRVDGAKRLASELLKQEHKAEWDKAKRVEYETIHHEAIEYTETQQDDDCNDIEVTKTKQELKLDAPSYDEWLNETTIVSEAVEATYDDEGLELTPYVPETKELVRAYTSLNITDEMVEAKLNEFRDVKQEALDYLASTDWYVVRYVEKGIKVPVDIINNRQLAREKLN